MGVVLSQFVKKECFMKMLQKVVKNVGKNVKNAECKNTVTSVRVALFMIGIL